MSERGTKETDLTRCMCPGCPRDIPGSWVSGLCAPCANADCDCADFVRVKVEVLEQAIEAMETGRAEAAKYGGELARLAVQEITEALSALRAAVQGSGEGKV